MGWLFSGEAIQHDIRQYGYEEYYVHDDGRVPFVGVRSHIIVRSVLTASQAATLSSIPFVKFCWERVCDLLVCPLAAPTWQKNCYQAESGELSEMRTGVLISFVEFDLAPQGWQGAYLGVVHLCYLEGVVTWRLSPS